MTTENHAAIPKWILWYAALIAAAVPFALGVMTVFGPNLGTVALADRSMIDTALFKYGVRNIAAGVVMAFAIYMRSAAMLLVVFIMRFITEGGDLLDAVLFGGMDTTSLLYYAALMVVVAYVPYAIAIRQLWPLVRK